MCSERKSVFSLFLSFNIRLMFFLPICSPISNRYFPDFPHHENTRVLILSLLYSIIDTPSPPWYGEVTGNIDSYLEISYQLPISYQFVISHFLI